MLGPLLRRPTRNPAICTSDRLPSLIASMTLKISLFSRSKFSVSFERIGLIVPLPFSITAAASSAVWGTIIAAGAPSSSS
jgi:hypothetical protein